MVESLGDDYSTYLTPKEAQSVRSTMQGNFEGVGMFFEKRNDIPTVVAPIPNTRRSGRDCAPRTSYWRLTGETLPS
jgi:carboxyl-terminal processing protease